MASGDESGPLLTYKEMGTSATQLQGPAFILTICEPRIRAELPLSSETQPPADVSLAGIRAEDPAKPQPDF